MVKKRKRAARIDLLTEDMLLAEEDLAAMRPALAVAPELILQTIQATRRRARKKATARKRAARSRHKAAPKIASKMKSRAPARKKKARA